MALQLYVQAHLEYYHILTQTEFSQKWWYSWNLYHFTNNLNFWKLVQSTIQPSVKLYILFWLTEY